MPSFTSAISVALFASLVSPAVGVSYSQSDSYVGSEFNSGFSYQAISDPTNGRVNYVDAAAATNQNLTYTSDDTFILRADYMNVLDPVGAGRDSVRIQSNKQYGSNTVMVFNMRHMPQGCGTWPAVWTVAVPWPTMGEIDIVEGSTTRRITRRLYTLLKAAQCRIRETKLESCLRLIVMLQLMATLVVVFKFQTHSAMDQLSITMVEDDTQLNGLILSSRSGFGLATVTTSQLTSSTEILMLILMPGELHLQTFRIPHAR